MGRLLAYPSANLNSQERRGGRGREVGRGGKDSEGEGKGRDGGRREVESGGERERDIYIYIKREVDR